MKKKLQLQTTSFGMPRQHVGKNRWADDNEQTKPVIALGNDRSSFTERAIRDTCRKGKDVFTLCSSGTTLCCRPYERCTEDELGEIFKGRSRKRKQTSNKHHSLRPTGKHTVMVRNVVPLSWTAQCSWKEASIVSPTRRMRQYEKNIGLWGNRKKKLNGAQDCGNKHNKIIIIIIICIP